MCYYVNGPQVLGVKISIIWLKEKHSSRQKVVTVGIIIF